MGVTTVTRELESACRELTRCTCRLGVSRLTVTSEGRLLHRVHEAAERAQRVQVADAQPAGQKERQHAERGERREQVADDQGLLLVQPSLSVPAKMLTST